MAKLTPSLLQPLPLLLFAVRRVFDLMPVKEMCCCSPVDARQVFAVFGADPLATSSTLATVKVALCALQFDEMPSHVDHAAKSRLVQAESM
ncbi:hypothetical protein Zm00014a_011972 [Zea mays]|uniref:Uncharacterized protein n=1 Tax=Zea mays TaxID=4577 RepID=A0A317YFP9_MAIZE|nr:hypothetical protein Zm00014a_011972 [Zea mays]